MPVAPGIGTYSLKRLDILKHCQMVSKRDFPYLQLDMMVLHGALTAGGGH